MANATRQLVLGIDIGAETIRVLVCETSRDAALRAVARIRVVHEKNPPGALRDAVTPPRFPCRWRIRLRRKNGPRGYRRA